MAKSKRQENSDVNEDKLQNVITIEIFDSLSGEEKEHTILEKIDDIVKSHIATHYLYENLDQDQIWLDLILRIAKLEKKEGLIVEDSYEIDSVVFEAETTELIWYNMGRFKIPTSLYLQNAPKLKIKS